MIVYSHWIQRRRDIPPPALSRDSGNRDRAAHPDRHASVGPATAKKSSIETFAVGRMRNGGYAVARSIAPPAPVDSDALARAIAEIEIASAALRQSEPALEPWRPNSETHGEQRYLPVWILIGAVWIAALLGLSGATGAILYLAG